MSIRHGARDRGFTLVELLIVIVILGLLAAVTVFAVRGITARSQGNACATELRDLQSAQEVHWTLTGAYGDGSQLVAGGALRSAPTNYEVTTTGGGAGYSIAPSSGSSCTAAASDGAAAPPPPPGPVTMPTSPFAWHGGVTAWRYPADVGGDDEVIVLGRSTGQADWVAANDAGVTSPRRTHFVDMDSLDKDSLDTLIDRARSNGVTALVVYTPDDTAPLPGAGTPTIDTYLDVLLAGEPTITRHRVGAGGFQGVLASL